MLGHRRDDRLSAVGTIDDQFLVLLRHLRCSAHRQRSSNDLVRILVLLATNMKFFALKISWQSDKILKFDFMIQ